LCQFVDGKFDEQLLSTIGVDFKFRRVKIGSDEVKLQIWDTAGTFTSIKVNRHFDPSSAHIITAQMPSFFATIYLATKALRYFS
jgi:GTPase SAR1 family protein